MSEKIKELVTKANLTEVIDDAYQERNDWQPVIEKFAKLIIQECCGVCESDPVGDDPACCTNTAFRIARKINSHFGIE